MTQNNKWIEWVWTAENPYPETLDTMVYVKLANNMEFVKYCNSVAFWFDGENSWSPEEVDVNGEHITHYKLA